MKNFSPDLEVKRLLFVEIGVLSGGSLFMWKKYFGNDARIIGVELNPDAKKFEDYGFEIFIGNQSDPNFWNNFFKKLEMWILFLMMGVIQIINK
jgi:hypothetical protein